MADASKKSARLSGTKRCVFSSNFHQFLFAEFLLFTASGRTVRRHCQFRRRNRTEGVLSACARLRQTNSKEQTTRSRFIPRAGLHLPPPRSWPVTRGAAEGTVRLRPFLRAVGARRSTGSGKRTAGRISRPRQLQERNFIEDYATCRSRRRALRPKKSAWLATAETTASWKGLAMRNAGSGRWPVRKRSG